MESNQNFIDIRNEARKSVLWKDEVSHLDFRTFTTKDNYVPISDEIAFNPIHVDHSISASYGFLIYIGGRKVAYTGDFRMHGRKSNLTEDFLTQVVSKVQFGSFEKKPSNCFDTGRDLGSTKLRSENGENRENGRNRVPTRALAISLSASSWCTRAPQGVFAPGRDCHL